MAERKPAKKTPAQKTTASKGFTAEERAAMKERAQELKAAASKEEGAKAVLAKIAEMPKADRVLAERFHAIVTASAPDLAPRTWYGMPAYAQDGKIVCFFKSARQVQVAVRHVRVRGNGAPRRRHDVADLLRGDEADAGR